MPTRVFTSYQIRGTYIVKLTNRFVSLMHYNGGSSSYLSVVIERYGKNRIAGKGGMCARDGGIRFFDRKHVTLAGRGGKATRPRGPRNSALVSN